MARLPRGQSVRGGDTAYHISITPRCICGSRSRFTGPSGLQERGKSRMSPPPAPGIRAIKTTTINSTASTANFADPARGRCGDPRPVRFPGAPSVDEKHDRPSSPFPI